MVRGDYLENNGDTVRAFVAATVLGWQDYLWGDPEAGNALILKDNPEMTPELLAYAINAIKSNAMVGDRASVGTMDPATWQQFYSDMSDLGALPMGIDVRAAYSLDYLPKPTGKD